MTKTISQLYKELTELFPNIENAEPNVDQVLFASEKLGVLSRVWGKTKYFNLNAGFFSNHPMDRKNEKCLYDIFAYSTFLLVKHIATNYLKMPNSGDTYLMIKMMEKNYWYNISINNKSGNAIILNKVTGNDNWLEENTPPLIYTITTEEDLLNDINFHL